MATTARVLTRCDLCGYEGRPGLFIPVDGHDFCRWCTSGPIRSTDSGGHSVTVASDTWCCDCGMTMAMLKLKLWRHGVDHEVMAAVPNLVSATAKIHVQTPRWPRAW